MNSLKFKMTLIPTGVIPGKYDDLKNISILSQTILARVYKATGIKFCVEVNSCRMVTGNILENGVGGTKSFTIESSTTFIQTDTNTVESWKDAVRLFARYIKAGVQDKYSTVGLEFIDCNIEYIKDKDILELIDKKELMIGDNIRFIYNDEYIKAVYAGINGCKTMIHIAGDKDTWLYIDDIFEFEKLLPYPEKKFSILNKVNGVIFHPDVTAELLITPGEIQYMLSNIMCVIDNDDCIDITIDKRSTLFRRFAVLIRNPRTGIMKYNGGPQETVDLLIGENKYVCRFSDYNEQMKDDEVVFNIKFTKQ